MSTIENNSSNIKKHKWWRPLSKKSNSNKNTQNTTTIVKTSDTNLLNKPDSILKSNTNTNRLQLDGYFRVKETDTGIQIQVKSPHLLAINKENLENNQQQQGDIDKTSIQIYPLKVGRTTIGYDLSNDIILEGYGVESLHCFIEYIKVNEKPRVRIYPIAKLCSIDGVIIKSPYDLKLGDTLCIGVSNYFRYNNPFEEEKERKTIDNTMMLDHIEYFDQIINDSNSNNNNNNNKMSETINNLKDIIIVKTNHLRTKNKNFLQKFYKFELLSRNNPPQQLNNIQNKKPSTTTTTANNNNNRLTIEHDRNEPKIKRSISNYENKMIQLRNKQDKQTTSTTNTNDQRCNSIGCENDLKKLPKDKLIELSKLIKQNNASNNNNNNKNQSTGAAFLFNEKNFLKFIDDDDPPSSQHNTTNMNATSGNIFALFGKSNDLDMFDEESYSTTSNSGGLDKPQSQSAPSSPLFMIDNPQDPSFNHHHSSTTHSNNSSSTNSNQISFIYDIDLYNAKTNVDVMQFNDDEYDLLVRKKQEKMRQQKRQQQQQRVGKYDDIKTIHDITERIRKEIELPTESIEADLSIISKHLSTISEQQASDSIPKATITTSLSSSSSSSTSKRGKNNQNAINRLSNSSSSSSSLSSLDHLEPLEINEDTLSNSNSKQTTNKKHQQQQISPTTLTSSTQSSQQALNTASLTTPPSSTTLSDELTTQEENILIKLNKQSDDDDDEEEKNEKNNLNCKRNNDDDKQQLNNSNDSLKDADDALLIVDKTTTTTNNNEIKLIINEKVDQQQEKQHNYEIYNKNNNNNEANNEQDEDDDEEIINNMNNNNNNKEIIMIGDDISLSESQVYLKENYEKAKKYREFEEENALNEKKRLQEILDICMEFQKQEQNKQQQRILTNGILTSKQHYNHHPQQQQQPQISPNNNNQTSGGGQANTITSSTSSSSSVTSTSMSSSSISANQQQQQTHHSCVPAINSLISKLNQQQKQTTELNPNKNDIEEEEEEEEINETVGNNAASYTYDHQLDQESSKLINKKTNQTNTGGITMKSLNNNNNNNPTTIPTLINNLNSINNNKDKITTIPDTTTTTSLQQNKINNQNSNLPQIQLIKNLNKNKSNLLTSLNYLKQQIQDIEMRQREALRDLEMERALLDVEHNNELKKLQSDEIKLNNLQKEHQLCIETYQVHMSKIRNEIELAKETMKQFETEIYLLESSINNVNSGGSSGGDGEQIDKLKKSKSELLEEAKHKHEDLEFQLMELEAKYDAEIEEIQNRLLNEQENLFEIFKQRQHNLKDYDQQQMQMLKQVKDETDYLENERQKLIEQFKKEKQQLQIIDNKLLKLEQQQRQQQQQQQQQQPQNLNKYFNNSPHHYHQPPTQIRKCMSNENQYELINSILNNPNSTTANRTTAQLIQQINNTANSISSSPNHHFNASTLPLSLYTNKIMDDDEYDQVPFVTINDDHHLEPHNLSANSDKHNTNNNNGNNLNALVGSSSSSSSNSSSTSSYKNPTIPTATTNKLLNQQTSKTNLMTTSAFATLNSSTPNTIHHHKSSNMSTSVIGSSSSTMPSTIHHNSNNAGGANHQFIYAKSTGSLNINNASPANSPLTNLLINNNSNMQDTTSSNLSIMSNNPLAYKFAELEHSLAITKAENSALLEEQSFLLQLKLRERELEMLKEERKKREELEKKLNEEIYLKEKIIEENIKLRDKKQTQARPLTRYLPVRDTNFDLRQHVENSGHQIDAHIKNITINKQTCRGYLLKMGQRFKTWNKRWFVFDRSKRTLSYYLDRQETKLRGTIYFQSINEVYVDHMRTIKSPDTKSTFIVKTLDRNYFFVAPSPETMRIWVDVIFTGAEGYLDLY